MKVNKWEQVEMSIDNKEILKLLGFEDWEVVSLTARYSGFYSKGIALTIRKKKVC